jgi:WD40 repeat protein
MRLFIAVDFLLFLLFLSCAHGTAIRLKFVVSREFNHGGRVMCLALSPDESVLVSTNLESEVKVWDLKRGSLRHEFTSYGRGPSGVTYFNGGRNVAFGCRDNGIHIVESETWKRLVRLDDFIGLGDVVVLRDDETLIAGRIAEGPVGMWNWKTGKLKASLEGHQQRVLPVATTPDEAFLATGGWDLSIRLWDLKRFQTVRVLKGHTDMIECLVFSPDGQKLVSAGFDDTIRIWETETGNLLFTLKDHRGGVWALAMFPDGESFVSGSADKELRIWNLSTGKCIDVVKGHKEAVHALAISKDGKTLFSGGSDGRIFRWELASTGK